MAPEEVAALKEKIDLLEREVAAIGELNGDVVTTTTTRDRRGWWAAIQPLRTYQVPAVLRDAAIPEQYKDMAQVLASFRAKHKEPLYRFTFISELRKEFAATHDKLDKRELDERFDAALDWALDLCRLPR